MGHPGGIEANFNQQGKTQESPGIVNDEGFAHSERSFRELKCR
jgi:hypothetical protein